NKVTLDGSASSAPGSDQLNFSWSVISSPSGSAISTATLTGAVTPSPSFTPDVAGAYVAQLIVTDATTGISSAPATVEISTDDVPPVADAGARQFVAPGSTVQLDGSKSADAAGHALTYSWALLAKPSGSSASLSGASASNPTFVADVAGNYVAQVIVSDSILTSVPDTVLIVATTGAFGVTPTSLDCGTQFIGTTSNCSPALTITNTGTGNLKINSIQISGANASEFAFTAPALPATIPPNGSMTVNVTFSPASAGSGKSASLVVNDTGPGSPHTVALTGTGQATTISANPTSVSFPGQLLNTTSSNPVPVTISNTGASSLTISAISITGANASEFAFTSAALPITVASGGSTTINLTFTPSNTGTRTATLDISNSVTNPTPLTVALSGTGVSSASIIIPPALSTLSLGGNLEALATASLSVNNSGPGSLTVTVASGDPTKLLVSSDTSGTTAGQGSISLTVPAGAGAGGVGGFYVQALASSGTVPLTISASGYNSATANITLTPSGFVLTGPSGQGVNFSTATGATPSPLSVSAAKLDNNKNFVAVGKLRGGSSASVAITSGTPATGTIAGSPAVVAGGTTTSTNAVTFNPVAAGTSLLSATAPAGFSTPATGASLTATVTAPAISVNPVTVGSNLQLQGTVSLQVAPPSGTQVTITSSDPTKVLLSADLTGATPGTATITYTATTQNSKFFVQGLAVTSTPVTLTTSATGYTTTTSQVAVTPAGFVITAGGSSSFTTTTISPTTKLNVSPFRLDSSFNPVGNAAPIRAGLTVNVPLLSGTPSTGTISGSPVTFHGGDTSNNTASFVPNHNASGTVTSVLSVDTANISVPGFSAATGGTVTATVTQPAITISMANTAIGNGLQVQASGSLNANTTASGLTITVSSPDPHIVLSSSATTAGGSSIQLQIPPNSGLNGSSFPIFYVQAKAASGNAVTLTASASGWTSGTIQVTLAPSALVLRGPNGIGAAFAASISQGSKALSAESWQLDPSTLAPVVAEAVSGGSSAAFTISQHGAANVATITPGSSSVVGGSSSTGLTFTPGPSTGSTTISVSEPAGFTTPSSGDSLAATVSP
ncbi:MAG TPA: choice-of-anchor D domain-containing protein, partial [Terriglobales bacterium]|nr:choice-of-anchor D domain-containing protein [Terriglobales bacterium]